MLNEPLYLVQRRRSPNVHAFVNFHPLPPFYVSHQATPTRDFRNRHGFDRMWVGRVPSPSDFRRPLPIMGEEEGNRLNIEWKGEARVERPVAPVI